MRTHARVALAAAGLGAITLLAGCGGGEKRLSKDAYAQEVETV